LLFLLLGMTVKRHVVAVGGGGFLMDDSSGRQERFILSLCREREAPRVLFLGTAGGDGERGQVKFFRQFSALGARCDVLPFFPYEMKRDYARAVREADVIYVGGGNTPAMLAVWREFGFDRALRAAYDDGTVLAGISAGANCWFERYVTDSVPGGGVMEGLGFVPGAFCPHLDSEAWRQPMLAALSGPAVGAGDHVAVHFVDGRPHEALHSCGDGSPLCVRRQDGASATLQPWPARALTEPSNPHEP
jgi:dipeptidase E